MSAKWLHNPVHRVAEQRARGLFPVLPPEMFVGFVAGLLSGAVLSVSWGVCIGVGVICLLFSWRMYEHDRTDYFIVFLRRKLPGVTRCYNACQADHDFVDFDCRGG